MFSTPELSVAAPLVPVVVKDWNGTCVVDGVPEILEKAGCAHPGTPEVLIEEIHWLAEQVIDSMPPNVVAVGFGNCEAVTVVVVVITVPDVGNVAEEFCPVPPLAVAKTPCT